MMNVYTAPETGGVVEHEVMPPHRTARVAAAPPSAPPMDVPAPVGVSLMC